MITAASALGQAAPEFAWVLQWHWWEQPEGGPRREQPAVQLL